MPSAVATLLREGHRARLGQLEPGNGSPVAVANRWLGTESRKLRAAHIRNAFDDTAIRDYADHYASLCARMPSPAQRRAFARSLGIDPPTGKHLVDEGASRLDDPLWWRRQLRKIWTRAAENSMRALGVVRKDREPYASNEAVRHHRAQARRARESLARTVAVNEEDTELNLLEVHERSLANPALRRAEFMMRIRGFEETAQRLGHVAEFVTLTAPSEFHAQLARGGANPKFANTVVRDAQAWLCKAWAKVRAKLRRLKILLYGVRVAEPHHDGTPHWHVLAFIPSDSVWIVRKVIQDYWLEHDSHTVGALSHRVHFETIDPTQGSATGYVAKYLSKNIDAHGCENESDIETGEPLADSLARVHAWASIHGIRQFQCLGGPPIGLWREFRRLRNPVRDRDLERCRAFADDGDFNGFIESVGGIRVGRRTNPRLEREPYSGELTRYGERRTPRICGVRYASACEISRPHHWRLERAGHHVTGLARIRAASGVPFRSLSSLGPVTLTVRTPDQTYAWIFTVPYRARTRAAPD